MFLLFKILFLFFAVNFPVYAENFTEYDADVGAFLAAGMSEKFPCKRAAQLGKGTPRPYMSTLWQSFGDSTKCLEKFIEASGNKSHTLQFYLSNEVCRRKENCFPQELEHKLSVADYNKRLCKGRRRTLSRVIKRILDIKRFCNEKGSEKTHCLLSIGLESQFNQCAASRLVRLAKRHGWHKRELIHNPVPGGPYQGSAGAFYVERHGIRLQFSVPPLRRIATLDGIDPDFCRDKNGRHGAGDRISTPDMQSWTDSYKKRVAYLAYWCSVHQGLTSDSGSAPDPKARTPYVPKAHISKFIEISNQERQKGKPIPGWYRTKGCTEVHSSNDGPGGFLWKESEHRGLVVLMPGKYDIQFNKIEVIRPYGKSEELYFTGWANADSDGPRQHWRLNKSISEFPRKVVVKATLRDSVFSEKQELCWTVFKSEERND